MQRPLLSTLIRSQVPAPNNRVQFIDALPARLPIIVLSYPSVTLTPAPEPTAILPHDVTEHKAKSPIAILPDEILPYNEA